MQVIPNSAALLRRDQQVKFKVEAWDTPYAALQNGAASTGLRLDVREPVAETSDWMAYYRAFRAAGDNHGVPGAVETAFTAAPSTAIVTNGRTPHVQHYWGSGGPNWWGSTKTGRVAVKFSGTVVPTPQRAWLPGSDRVLFGVAGSGYVVIQVVTGGTPTTVWSGEVSESSFLQTGFAYTTGLVDLAGKDVVVYYVQSGLESWGGVVVKTITSLALAPRVTEDDDFRITEDADFRVVTIPLTVDTTGILVPEILAEATRTAPVLCAGLVSADPVLLPVELPFIRSVQISTEPGAASRAEIEVPLLNPSQHDGHGWIYERTDPAAEAGKLALWDNGERQFALRRKRLIRVTVFTPDEFGALTVETPVFTGHLDDFAESSRGVATLQCVGFEGRLVEQYEQAPDRISYMAYNFRTTDMRAAEAGTRLQPVFNVPAFDNWPLQFAVQELGIRGGLDPSCYAGEERVADADGRSTSVRTPWTRALAKFRAQAMKDGTFVRLPRPVHYGNVGTAFTESRPFDEEYVFKVEPTKDLWSRTRELTDRVGYIVRFDEAGEAVLRPAQLPSYIADLARDATTVTTGLASTTREVHPNAYAAAYLRSVGPVTVEKVVYAARVDISFPLQANLGAWTVTVHRVSDNELMATRTITITGGGDEPYFLFDAPVVQSGDNATVTTVFSGAYDQYKVIMASSGGTGSTVRLVDCVLCYGQDPMQSVLPTPLDTGDLAFSVESRPQQDAMRNKVTIVGRRKAAVTDSEKLLERAEPTSTEFVVQNAVDVRSITDPAADNFVGYQKQSVIYDASIADEGFAKYLAKVFIYRQRMPKPGAVIEAPLLPQLQIGDVVTAVDSRFQTVTAASPLFVRKVRHRFEKSTAKTTIEAESWPDYPAYEPRMDIDLAEFDNQPVINIETTYKSLSGHLITNPSEDTYQPTNLNENVQYLACALTTVGGRTAIALPANAPWPPQPGTVQIRQGGGGTTANVTQQSEPFQGMTTRGTLVATFWNIPMSVMSVAVTVNYFGTITGLNAPPMGTFTATQLPSDYFYYTAELDQGSFTYTYRVYRGSRSFASGMPAVIRTELSYVQATSSNFGTWLANTPYHHFFDIDYRDGHKFVFLKWDQGDNSGRFTRDPAVTTYDVRYRALSSSGDKYAGVTKVPNNAVTWSPFYDPYTSELGELVTFKFDVLADGLYRVAVKSVKDDITVAYLTEPSADPTDPEQHWTYLTVGAERTFRWDGVDLLGEWNTVQSELYASLVESTFEADQQPRIGKGFYAWNTELTAGELGELALIWYERNPATGRPYIGQGTFGAWYLSIEAVTDPVETTVSSKEPPLGTPQVLILTHLPEPTKLELQVHDWPREGGYIDATQGHATATSTTLQSVTAPAGPAGGALQWQKLDQSATPSDSTLFAYINNEKPVRLRFRVAERPGKLWEGKQDEVSVKLTRQVHLRAYIGDQSVLYKGSDYPDTATEQRTVLNRRLVNDEHTLSFVDTGYRKAKTFRWTDGDDGKLEWIFRPEDFKKDFLYNGLKESLEFGNYLQLEEVPGWNTNRGIASSRSRLQFAIMSYLFYLSAYVTDRSGRSCWGMNRAFVDKSKISLNAPGSWWNPNAPQTAATAETYQLDWPDDPMYQQRRTVVCRQWAAEPNWKSGQLTKFGYTSNTIYDALLEHFWWQHEISSLTWNTAATTIGYSKWATSLPTWASFDLPTDPYSFTHTTAAPGWQQAETDQRLPSAWATSHRALGFMSTPGVPITSIGKTSSGTTVAGQWNWEDDAPWLPSISRDLHPFYLIPPMGVPSYALASIPERAGKNNTELDLRQGQFYSVVESALRDYNNQDDKNEGADAGAAETWSSPVYLYLTGGQTTKELRFWSGQKVDAKAWPFKNDKNNTLRNITEASADYLRQDDTVHWEELRGFFSRGKRPGETPIRVSATSPYYWNPVTYDHIMTGVARKNNGYPKFHCQVDRWFSVTFRHEYLWESASMFPVNDKGAERLDAVLWWRTRFDSSLFANTVKYDDGAWVGWKDDGPHTVASSPTAGVFGNELGWIKGWKYDYGTNTSTAPKLSPFKTSTMPVAVGPLLPQTVQLSAHMVLVPERRGGSL